VSAAIARLDAVDRQILSLYLAGDLDSSAIATTLSCARQRPRHKSRALKKVAGYVAHCTDVSPPACGRSRGDAWPPRSRGLRLTAVRLRNKDAGSFCAVPSRALWCAACHRRACATMR